MRDYPVYTQLHNRSLIEISGHNSVDFLQGLISNDIHLLKSQSAIYSCLLTPNGKFLYDFFIYQKDAELLIECEGGARAEDLMKRLQLYKLRADVYFKLTKHIDVYAIYYGDTEDAPYPTTISNAEHSEHIIYPDPRHREMGFRSFIKPEKGESASFEEWDRRRIKFGIPDGTRDMIPEKSTLLECNIDQFNGISYEKGCYMGQELTARMHYRALTKKTLCAVQFENAAPAPFTDLHDNDGKLIGEMRSSCDNIGLALIKKDALQKPQDLPFKQLSSS